MLIFLELRTFQGKNLDKTYLSNILLWWENQRKCWVKGQVYAFWLLITWHKVGISHQERKKIVILMCELSLPGPGAVQLYEHLLIVYLFFFFLQSWCWFVFKILSTTEVSTWYRIFKGFNLSPFLLTFLSDCLIYFVRFCPRHQSFPGFRASFDFKRDLGG